MKKELKRLGVGQRKAYRVFLAISVFLLIYTIFAWFYDALSGGFASGAWIMWAFMVYAIKKSLKEDLKLEKDGIKIGDSKILSKEDIDNEKRIKNKRALNIILSISILASLFINIYLIFVPIVLMVILNRYYKTK